MDPDGAGSTMELPPPELHANMLAAIELTPKQRRAALAYRNHLLSRMGATLRLRKDISLQLLRTLGAQRLPADKQVGLLPCMPPALHARAQYTCWALLWKRACCTLTPLQSRCCDHDRCHEGPGSCRTGRHKAILAGCSRHCANAGQDGCLLATIEPAC